MKKYKDIKASLRRSNDMENVLCSLRSLSEKYKEINDSELLEYVPIKIVSCFEEILRGQYKEIIDRPEGRKNLKKLKCLRDFRLDFEVIDAFQNREITLGDYLSYFLPCSSVAQIMENLTNLLDVDFKKLFNDRLFKNKECTTSSSDIDYEIATNLLSSVDEIFKVRHMLCHEGALVIGLDSSKTLKMISDSLIFLDIIKEAIWSILFSNDKALTQAEMNELSFENLEKLEDKLKEIIERIKHKSDCSDFSYIDIWKSYRKKRAESDALCCEGGSMYPCVYAISMANTTDQLISELKVAYRLYDLD